MHLGLDTLDKLDTEHLLKELYKPTYFPVVYWYWSKMSRLAGMHVSGVWLKGKASVYNNV